MERFFKGKKVLVTGHSGFKGSWLTQILLRFGADVVGVSLRPTTEPNLFTLLELERRAKSYFCDIRNYEELKKVISEERPEIVFHLAAQALVRPSYEDPLVTYSTNVLGTANVLQILHELGCARSVVVVTTDKVYKNLEWIYPYRENEALGGYDPYSASKAAADIVSQSYIQSFFNPADFGTKHQTLVAVARAGNVIGGGDWAEYRLIPDIMRSIIEKKEKVIIRNPYAIRPWEHVLEPLSGYLDLSQKLYAGEVIFSDAWNFGPNDESFVEVEVLVKEVLASLEKGEYEVQGDHSKHEATLLKLDTTKAKTLLHWRPRLDFRKNIKFTVDWYKGFYQIKETPIVLTDRQIDSFFND